MTHHPAIKAVTFTPAPISYPALTDEQAAALEAFAGAHKGDWRATLRACWALANYPRDALHPHALQQVRNSFGPTWLSDVYAWHWSPVLPKWVHAPFKDDATAEAADPDAARWSAPFDPPAIGDKVRVRINGIGPGVVTGYFVEDGWLGVIVKNDSPPGFYVKQNHGNVPGHSFGAEIDLLEEAA